MEYRLLGRTGLTVSAIGFGTWGIGGVTAGATSYGPTDDKTSLDALAAALDLGITFFDTADAYGDGHAEHLLGRALRGRRPEMVIATKGGFPRFDQPKDFTPSALRHTLEASLRRLGTDYVDLYQLHGPSQERLEQTPDIVETCHALRQEGKIRAFALSANAPADALPAIKRFAFPAVQVNLNLVDQRAVQCGLLALAERHGIGLIARTPLCFGFLSGCVAPDRLFDSSDHRSRWSKAQIDRWIEGSRQFVEAVAGNTARTPAQIALGYCLGHKKVSTTIPGMMHRAEVEENVQATPLSEEAMAAIAALYAGQTYFVAAGNRPPQEAARETAPEAASQAHLEPDRNPAERTDTEKFRNSGLSFK